MKEIIVQFQVENPKLISVNDQYIHPVRKTKRGSYTSYFAKSPYLKEVQEYYSEILSDLISEEDINDLKSTMSDKTHGLEFVMEIGMPLKDLTNHDVSNFIKSVEDCVVSRTGIDDCYDYRVVSEKELYESETGSWIMKVTIRPYEVKSYLIM